MNPKLAVKRRSGVRVPWVAFQKYMGMGMGLLKTYYNFERTGLVSSIFAFWPILK